MFEHVDAYPGDPILTLNENFQKDPRQDKVNLSIGIYLSLIHISEPTRLSLVSRMPSSA